MNKDQRAYRKAQKSISESVRSLIYERDGHRCLKCNTSLNLTIDHIKPVGLGGTKDPDNLQTLCARCNSDKGQQTIDYRVMLTERNIQRELWSDERWNLQLKDVADSIAEMQREQERIKSQINHLNEQYKALCRKIGKKSIYRNQLLKDIYMEEGARKRKDKQEHNLIRE